MSDVRLGDQSLPRVRMVEAEINYRHRNGPRNHLGAESSSVVRIWW